MIYSGAPSAHLGALAATIRDKLQNNCRCLYLNSPPMVAGIRSNLSVAGVDVAHEIAKASLVLSSDTQQRAGGRFNIDKMMGLLADALKQALADGYDGLWASGDMTWEFGQDRDYTKLLEYEWRLEEFFQQNPALQGVCQYHAEMFPAEVLRQGLLTHPGVYINESLSRLNPHFRPPRSYGAEAAADAGLDEAVGALRAAPVSSTGRLIIEGWASINVIALASVRFAFAASSSLRKVVPARLSTVSQPNSLHHFCRRGASMPAVL